MAFNVISDMVTALRTASLYEQLDITRQINGDCEMTVKLYWICDVSLLLKGRSVQLDFNCSCWTIAWECGHGLVAFP